MKRQDAAREQAETDRVKPGFALGGGGKERWMGNQKRDRHHAKNRTRSRVRY